MGKINGAQLPSPGEDGVSDDLRFENTLPILRMHQAGALRSSLNNTVIVIETLIHMAVGQNPDTLVDRQE